MSTHSSKPQQPRSRSRGGFSLLEVVISTLIVGVVLVVALNALGQATLGRLLNAHRGRALQLADDLMSEILETDYEDPAEATVGIGPEASEVSASNRSAFDDVDDYHGWNVSPPQDKLGVAIPDLTDWERSVDVAYVNPVDLTSTLGSDGGIKRVIVTVRFKGQLLATLTSVATRASQKHYYESID